MENFNFFQDFGVLMAMMAKWVSEQTIDEIEQDLVDHVQSTYSPKRA